MQDVGALRIELDLANGLVCAAAIRSSRPMGLARLFLGRPVAEAAPLAARLFTLCSRAQAAAASAAVRAATRARPDPESLRREAIAVAAERVVETLRALVMAWPAQTALLGRIGPPLRDASLAAASLALNGGREALDALRVAARRLGFGDDPPPEDSALAQILRQCAKAPPLALTPPDALTPRDDAAVGEALEAAPRAFAAAPELPGRRPETGAFARVWRETPEDVDALSARALAKALDARHALAELEALILVKAPPGPEALRSAVTASGAGLGAVECARGRLYHWVRLDGEGRIADYAIVAPTEWNFHPNGPLAALLIGARLDGAAAARGVAEKLATLVDPCVAFEVAVKELV
jgi:hypothetical protein